MASGTISPAPSIHELDQRFATRLRSIAAEAHLIHTMDWMQLAQLFEDAASVIERQAADFDDFMAERKLRHETESKLGSVLGLFGLKPGDISDEQFAEDTQQLLNEAGAFEKIRTAYCRFQDDGHDERFFEALSDVLDEHGLTPNPCPMCNKYGPHGHTI